VVRADGVRWGTIAHRALTERGAASDRMRGGSSTCTATCGNGARTGLVITTTPHPRQTIQPGHRPAQTGWTAAAVGCVLHPTPGLRAASRVRPSTALRRWASASRGQSPLFRWIGEGWSTLSGAGADSGVSEPRGTMRPERKGLPAQGHGRSLTARGRTQNASPGVPMAP
jgi:hypothetical protein